MADGRPQRYMHNFTQDALKRLEEEVMQAISKREWNLEPNLALLRHYQFDPQSFKPDISTKVMLLALSQPSLQQYRNCLSMIPEKLIRQAESLLSTVNLGDLLMQCSYSDFWVKAYEKKELCSMIDGFYEGAREQIALALSMTAQKLPKDVLGSALKLEGSQLDEYVKGKVASSGWQVLANGKVIKFDMSEFNVGVPRSRPQDALKYEKIAAALGLPVGETVAA